MGIEGEKLPSGNQAETLVQSAAELGAAVRAARLAQGLTQLDVASMSNTGNRFIIELEKGKPTLQLQKVFDSLALLGLEVIIRPRGRA